MNRHNKCGFTLIEIVIVIGIIGIIVAIAAPTWFRQREVSRAAACQENLAKIDGALEQYAIEFKVSEGAAVDYPTALINPGGVPTGQGFLKREPECPAGGSYSAPGIGITPTCSIGPNNDPFAAHEIQ